MEVIRPALHYLSLCLNKDVHILLCRTFILKSVLIIVFQEKLAFYPYVIDFAI